MPPYVIWGYHQGCLWRRWLFYPVSECTTGANSSLKRWSGRWLCTNLLFCLTTGYQSWKI